MTTVNKSLWKQRRLYEIITAFFMGIFFIYMNSYSVLPANPTFNVTDTLILGGVTFVKIPGETFAMGDSSSKALRNEQPVHLVTISTFWMARTEVTSAQWKTFLEQTNYPAGRSQAKSPAHPVVSVTWNDVQAYCNWFSKKYKVRMRLPTEAEWEFAARGGLQGKQFPNGDSMSSLHANYASVGSVPVAQYPANGYGLYDMAGNVVEWINDWYDKDYYQVSERTNPQGPSTEKNKVQRRGDRGGGWCMGVEMLRVSARHAGPGSWDQGGTADCLGFRPILEGDVLK